MYSGCAVVDEIRLPMAKDADEEVKPLQLPTAAARATALRRMISTILLFLLF